jgi:hypothetical protein
LDLQPEGVDVVEVGRSKVKADLAAAEKLTVEGVADAGVVVAPLVRLRGGAAEGRCSRKKKQFSISKAFCSLSTCENDQTLRLTMENFRLG